MNEKVNEAKEKAAEVKAQALNKADELYNKLPLDQINEKLGGKVDVKSKKFKMIAAGVLALIVVLILVLVLGGGTPSMTQNEMDQAVKMANAKAIENVVFLKEADEKEMNGMKGEAFKFEGDVVTKKDKKVKYTIIVIRDGGKSTVFAFPAAMTK